MRWYKWRPKWWWVEECWDDPNDPHSPGGLYKRYAWYDKEYRWFRLRFKFSEEGILVVIFVVSLVISYFLVGLLR